MELFSIHFFPPLSLFVMSQRPTLPSFPILTKPGLCKGPCTSEVIEVLIEVCIASVRLHLCDHAFLNFCNLPLQSRQFHRKL